MLEVASDVLNSSHRVGRRKFSNFFVVVELAARVVRRAASRALSNIALDCFRFVISDLRAVVENKLLQLWSSLSVSSFPGKPFVAIKLVIVGTAVY